MSDSSEPSLYWFDYETFGTQPAWDRPCQFAGIRTNLDLEEIGEPLMIFCQQTMDYLPHPMACRVTGLSPQQVNNEGLPEHQFIKRIVEEIGKPGTCSLGYNSIAFDDEFTRYTLFRNFYDAYEHEYKQGSSRWDLLDVVRLTRALRPEGIEWPFNDNGSPSNRLEHLSAANKIDHGNAHDALSDVRATIGMARLIRKVQPKLYNYLFEQRTKQAVSRLLNTVERNICLLVSRTIPAARSHITAILPLMPHPTNKNGVIVLDLLHDPANLSGNLSGSLSGNDCQELKTRLRTVQVNKCPIVVPFKTLRPEDAARLGMDIGAIKNHEQNARHLLLPEGLEAIKQAMVVDWPDAHPDPEGSLYGGGFMSAPDRERAVRLRSGKAEQITSEAAHFEDKRFTELAFRYQARNFSETLDAEAKLQWTDYCREKLLDDTGPWLSFSGFQEAMNEAPWTDAEADLKAALQTYADAVKAHASLDQPPSVDKFDAQSLDKSVGATPTTVHEVSTADDGPHGVHHEEGEEQEEKFEF